MRDPKTQFKPLRRQLIAIAVKHGAAYVICMPQPERWGDIVIREYIRARIQSGKIKPLHYDIAG